MKKFLIICILCTAEYSIGDETSCASELSMEFQMTQTELRTYFRQVTEALSQLDNAYADYQDIVDKQNELLKDLQQLNRENAIEEKQRAFLLNKAKQILGTSVDMVNSKE